MMSPRAYAAWAFTVVAVGASARDLPFVTFDGQKTTTFSFQELNDPVMGGRSTGTWSVNSTGAYGVFDGEVADVPSLKAPGFIKTAADGRFPDVSAAAGGTLVLKVRTSTPLYDGFRVSFASGALLPAFACASGGSLPLSRGCFKAHFTVPESEDFVSVRIPLASFSDRWSPYTGDQTATCVQDASACPTASKLRAIQRVELWAEGIGGRAHLEVRSISVEVPNPPSSQPPAPYDTCRGAVQGELRYGISGRIYPEVPVPVDPTETLAEAICCDERTKVYAEPQFLYKASDIDFFAKLGDKGVTTFYDSVCGVPLFKAPMNRTLDDFKADTEEHGWPSFRVAEVVTEHVHFDADGFVYSSCGTHLGSYLPDERGPRWCMDLSCIAGNPPSPSSAEATTLLV